MKSGLAHAGGRSWWRDGFQGHVSRLVSISAEEMPKKKSNVNNTKVRIMAGGLFTQVFS